MIVTIGLDQRTYSRSGRVSTGTSDVFNGLHSRPHHFVFNQPSRSTHPVGRCNEYQQQLVALHRSN